MSAKRYYLFIAHGSREASAAQGFETLLQSLQKALAPHAAGGAYLTLNEPSIPNAVAAARGEGYSDFVIVPLFFFEGAHLKNDIPQILADLKLKDADLDFQVMPPVASIEGFADWVVQSAAKKGRA